MGNENQGLAKETKQESLRPQHVLLIDDEAVVREIGCEMLESLGYQCIPAETGEEGIRLYQENKDKIALVILDIEMPGISGDKVYDKLKELEPDLKVLLISGYAKNYLEGKYFKRKLNPLIFMPKPFQLGQLSKKLETIMGSGKLGY
jgi:two-component system cell cycle sensor histidine kinase/response regulator CckA